MSFMKLFGTLGKKSGNSTPAPPPEEEKIDPAVAAAKRQRNLSISRSGRHKMKSKQRTSVLRDDVYSAPPNEPINPNNGQHQQSNGLQNNSLHANGGGGHPMCGSGSKGTSLPPKGYTRTTGGHPHAPSPWGPHGPGTEGPGAFCRDMGGSAGRNSALRPSGQGQQTAV